MKTWMILLALVGTNVWAIDDDSYTSYDAIVSELNASLDDVPPPPQEDWSEVALQAGMSFMTSFVSVTSNKDSGSGMLTGVEGHFGSNLFSKTVRGEVAFRTFVPRAVGSGVNVNLKELEGRIVLLPNLRPKTNLRMGFGMAARMLEVDDQSSTDPATSVFLGFEHKVSPAVSVGPDVAYRSTLNSGALDKSAWDAAIRLNATF